MDTEPTKPEITDEASRKRVARQVLKEAGRTPCGYPAGLVQASDGTRYQVTESGQFPAPGSQNGQGGVEAPQKGAAGGGGSERPHN